MADQHRVIRSVRRRRALRWLRPAAAVIGRTHQLDAGDLAIEFLQYEPNGLAARGQVRARSPATRVADRQRHREMFAVIGGPGIEEALSRLAGGEPGRMDRSGP